ncbi:MAG: hypothetical protein PHH13_02690 [Candidatus Peribacteraceae bacterium]|nr:hypothetical protein [Candidatus Peribacteraceae bacterium]
MSPHIGSGMGMRLEERMDTRMEERMEMQQIPQLSPNIRRPPGNRFRRERIRHFTTQRLQALLRRGADEITVDKALATFLQRIERIMPFDDYFFDPEAHARFLRGEIPDAVYLNHASIGTPCAAAVEKGRHALTIEQQLLREGDPGLAQALSVELARKLREKLAVMLKVDPSGIILTRNIGEAAVMAAALAGVYSRRSDEGPVAFADPTHISTMVNMLLVSDPGNVYGRDPFSTFPTHFRERGPQYKEDELRRWLGQDAFTIFAIRGKTRKQIQKEVMTHVKPCNPKAIVLPHVLRETGDELPIEEIGLHMQEHLWHASIIADGAQAVGNIDIDAGKLLGVHAPRPAVDFYLGGLHKAIGAPPMGFVAFDERRDTGHEGLERLRCGWAKNNLLILHGMFDHSLHVPTTVEDSLSTGDLYGALAQLEQLECARHICDLRDGPRMSVYFLMHERFRRREAFQKLLETRFGERWTGKDALQFIKPIHKATSLILTFRFPTVDMRTLTERLSKQGIFLTYTESYDAIRASFSPDNNDEQLRHCVEAMAREVKQMEREGPTVRVQEEGRPPKSGSIDELS